MIADSLPDTWGEKMLRVEVSDPQQIRTAVGKLAAIGQRGPGGLTFEPPIGLGDDPGQAESSLAQLSAEAARVAATPRPIEPMHVDRALARGGSSLGGAQPKITAHLRLGEPVLRLERVLIGGAPPPGHVPAILKLSPVDDEGGGAVEYAMMELAAAAGIRVPRHALVFDGERRHFAVERFDRYVRTDGSVGRRHVHSLSGLLHRRAVEDTLPLDYTDLMRVARTLCGVPTADECLRRAVFNLLATNRDDHGRNHAFIYDETARTWDASPAYDLNPNVANVLIALRWQGSEQVPTTFREIASVADLGGISPKRAREIFGEVEAAVYGKWLPLAADAGVPAAVAKVWGDTMVSAGRALRADVNRVSTKKPTRRR
jgi:serine/threonine-protein kinase HipA